MMKFSKDRSERIDTDDSEEVEVNLPELRARTNRSQAEIADIIGTSQSGVSRLERQKDLLVSTLNQYVRATGGNLHLIARYPNYEYRINLPTLHKTSERPDRPRTFRVVWQNMRTRKFVDVGRLEVSGGEFVFCYTSDAELTPDFQPFPSFPQFEETYRSNELFDFFADRVLLAASKSGYDHLLSALGLTHRGATAIELLARSWGTTPHDTIQVVPEPLERDDGVSVLPFLVSGARHVDDDNADLVSMRIAALLEGQQLDLRDEPDNPSNSRAILLEAKGEPVGWIPDYLLDEVHKHRDSGKRLSVVVEQANGQNTPWHLRLLCRLEFGS